ncbi:MAG TPA: hypothetical protein VJB10_01825, partial [Candidatus Peribacteraceae bacterium]|nr:hypothetical protein [Candidatus Peribacteraceae bacterium]
MATPEKPHAGQQENPDSQRLIDSFGLHSQLSRLNMSLGPETEKPKDNVPDMELQRWEEGILDRTVLTTFREFSVTNEILWRRKSIQHLKAIQEILDPQRPLGLRRKDELETERRELVVANQAMTYNEYLPAVIQQVSAFMDLYKEEFQQLLPYLPQEQREHLREQYRQSVEYLFVLKQAMD